MSVAQPDVTSNPDAEKAVLGAVLDGGGEAVMLRIPNASEDLFDNPQNLVIWGVICRMSADRERIDLLTVKARLTQDGQLKKAGGSSHISSLTDAVPDVSNVESYVRILERCAKQRAILAACKKASESVTENKAPEETIAKLFATVGEQATPQKMQARSIIEIVTSTSEKMRMLMTDDKSIGMETDWPSLNRLRVFRPTLVMWCCPSKMGKTAFGLSLSDDLARHGHPTAFVSLESDAEEVSLRHLSFSTGISHNLMQDWRLLKPEQLEAIAQHTRNLNSRPWHFIDRIRHVDDIVMELRRLKARHGLEAVFVDYAQNVKLKRKFDRQEQELHQISQAFLEASKDLKIHVSLLSQVTRDAGKDGARFAISNIKYAESLGISARMVFYLHRPFFADGTINSGGPSHKDYRDPHHMDVQVTANNEGGRGDFVAQFDEIRQRVWESTCEKPCMHEKCSRQQAEIAKQERLY